MSPIINCSASGCFRWQVIDAQTGRVVRESAWRNNIILNKGMNEVAVRPWADCFTVCMAAEGSAATVASSGTTTVSQSGTTATVFGGSFQFNVVTDIGKTIQFGSGGVDAMITAVGSVTQATVNVSQTVPSTTFKLFNTNQCTNASPAADYVIGANEERTSTYVTGESHCQTTFFGANLLKRQRTFDFPARGSDKTYYEIGVGWNNTVGSATLFARNLIPDGIVVLSGQKLRIIYQLNVSLFPTSPRTVGFTISGFPSGVGSGPSMAGVEQLQLHGLSIVDSTGATVLNTDGCNEPSTSANLTFWLSTSTNPVSTFNTVPVTRSSAYITTPRGVLTLEDYVTNSFTRVKTGSWDNPAGVNASGHLIRSMGIGSTTDDEFTDYGYVLVWDAGQNKPGTHFLTVRVNYSWSRVLVDS